MPEIYGGLRGRMFVEWEAEDLTRTVPLVFLQKIYNNSNNPVGSTDKNTPSVTYRLCHAV